MSSEIAKIVTADFYVGRGEHAEWAGSLRRGGSPELVQQVLSATKEETFRVAVAIFCTGHEQWAPPGRGWPWDWPNSSDTDYAYAFDDGRVWISWCGREWVAAADYHGDEDLPKTAAFPSMADG